MCTIKNQIVKRKSPACTEQWVIGDITKKLKRENKQIWDSRKTIKIFQGRGGGDGGKQQSNRSWEERKGIKKNWREGKRIGTSWAKRGAKVRRRPVRVSKWTGRRSPRPWREDRQSKDFFPEHQFHPIWQPSEANVTTTHGSR